MNNLSLALLQNATRIAKTEGIYEIHCITGPAATQEMSDYIFEGLSYKYVDTLVELTENNSGRIMYPSGSITSSICCELCDENSQTYRATINRGEFYDVDVVFTKSGLEMALDRECVTVNVTNTNEGSRVYDFSFSIPASYFTSIVKRRGFKDGFFGFPPAVTNLKGLRSQYCKRREDN